MRKHRKTVAEEWWLSVHW